MSWAASPAAAVPGTPVPGTPVPGTPAGGAVRGREPGQRRPPDSGGPGSGRPESDGQAAAGRALRSVTGLASAGGALVIWLALLGPVIALLTHLSGSAVASALTTPGDLDPLIVSLESGAVTLVVLLLLGTPLAWRLARGTLPFPRVWEAGVLCSLLLPPLVIGLLLIFMIGPYTFIGQLLGHLNVSTTNTFFALVVAQVYESAPYYVLGAQAAFASVDPRLEQQAELLGDRPRRVFRRVTLPLAAPGLAMALAVAWARAMGAFGAVVIIAYHPYGLPLQIYTTLQETGLATALPYALVLLVVALPLPLAAYIWSARARSRRRG